MQILPPLVCQFNHIQHNLYSMDFRARLVEWKWKKYMREKHCTVSIALLIVLCGQFHLIFRTIPLWSSFSHTFGRTKVWRLKSFLLVTELVIFWARIWRRQPDSRGWLCTQACASLSPSTVHYLDTFLEYGKRGYTGLQSEYEFWRTSF